MDAIDNVFDPLREFAKDSVRLVKRCHKPDRKEFSKVAVRTAIGFVVMGFVGFFVKLIFIPINNIIVGSGCAGERDEAGGLGYSFLAILSAAATLKR
ncbi:Protein transport protein Sec61 subunit gamma [Linum perenne]